jgi:hypothetical protein
VTPDVPVPSSSDVPVGPGVPADRAAEAALSSAADVGGAGDAEAVAAAQRAMRLVQLVREIEKHVAAEGWDQNPRLFALARTVELVALEPEIAEALGAEGEDPESYTPIEQEPLDDDRALDEVLATTMWPDEVVGAALVIERLVLPPSAEDALAEVDETELESAASSHPDRQDVRMAVVVTRDGGRVCALRLRAHDVDDEVLVGENIVPRLADALAATLS